MRPHERREREQTERRKRRSRADHRHDVPIAPERARRELRIEEQPSHAILPIHQLRCVLSDCCRAIASWPSQDASFPPFPAISEAVTSRLALDVLVRGGRPRQVTAASRATYDTILLNSHLAH